VLPAPFPLKIRLTLVLFGYGLVRIAGAAGGILVGLYVAEIANHRAHVGVALVGTLGAVSYAAELSSALPLGIAADHIPRGLLISGGALLGAAATQLFGMSGQVSIFFLSRSLEGMAAAAIAPALLAHLTDITAGHRA
jgi:MFS family permease